VAIAVLPKIGRLTAAAAVAAVLVSLGSASTGLAAVDATAVSQAAAEAATVNLLDNGGFEDGAFAPDVAPPPWVTAEYSPSGTLRWDDTVAHSGTKSVRIEASEANDLSFRQNVEVRPNTFYVASTWVRTQDVAHAVESADVGANICLFGTWDHSIPLLGTNDWTKIEIFFSSGDRTAVEICLRLGYWSGTTTGTAWFDDVQLTELVPSTPAPGWKLLVLIYGQTDVVLSDGHHVVATMTEDEKDVAEANATRFVTQDVPALTSGLMVPTLEVRFPDHPLDRLSPIAEGWWPSPGDVQADRDRAFDSLLVIWDPRVTDLTTGGQRWIGMSAGLTPDTGLGQTYLAMIIESATQYGHLNVFKHEFGHSILNFSSALGVGPTPFVTNHASEGQYVHCPTGTQYVWADENDANPIPNSIYNNESGFTHDYYSGTTAAAGDPTTCLGITPQVWAYGGPVSHPVTAPVVQCTIKGTPRADTLVGTAGDDVICGLGGNDVISGGGGRDRILGADGSDRLWGGGGDDVVVGGPGRDLLDGGTGVDRLYGSEGNDVLVAKDGARDAVSGGSGWDSARVDGRLDRVTGVEQVH
jgi:hypothetical protein